MEKGKGRLSRREFLKAMAAGTVLAGASPGLIVNPVSAAPAPSFLSFATSGYTNYGLWQADVSIDAPSWVPRQPLSVAAMLRVTTAHVAALGALNIKPDGFCALLTAERTFDADGILRLPSDERMSTLLTPTGLAIEGGVQGAVTNRFGYGFRTPVDELATQLLSAYKPVGDEYHIPFVFRTTLPVDLPPGIYRLRLDFGVTVKTTRYNLNGEAFAKRPFFKGPPTESHVYSPPIPVSGWRMNGQPVDAEALRPRIPWVILWAYGSNGYQGAIAEEDKPNFALSQRNLIHDEVVLPRFASDNRTVLSYWLEPQFPADTIDARSAIPWDYHKGELAISVTNPDGTTSDLGKYPFDGQRNGWPTTGKSAFTSWKPPSYGYYTVKATGWTADVWGNRYEGGGTYHFWIAKRMTMATATFQGFAYPVGSRYGRDIGFAPAFPAAVSVTATLYPGSDPAQARSLSYSGTASPGGIYGAAQGMQPFMLDAPGEYHAKILAQYTDQEGHLWVCVMRHAGAVYPADTPIVARGKKLTIRDKYVDRGETHTEGWIETPDITHLQHINYPFNSGDVLLIAAEGTGANKIEPVLNYETIANPAPYDPNLQTIGISNLRLTTSNGYSPHLFPEYITDRAYYYAGAPRPGFMSRFIVAEDGTRAPYWPVSPNSFGGQVNASPNGDVPGDIYRLIGGVVLRKKGQTPAYAGYLASAFILPALSWNNRIFAAGSEELNGAAGKARFFLVGTRPGMVYETGTAFAPAIQIDPVLPAAITYSLAYPDGRVVTQGGTGDGFGSWAGATRWTMDIPGLYKFTLSGAWQGFTGGMAGLPADGGLLFVMEKERPAGLPRPKLSLAEQSTFEITAGANLTGTTTAREVFYAAVTPGAVVDQGVLPVSGGKFSYRFDPAAIGRRLSIYDTVSVTTGKPQLGDVVQLTFFARETAPSGASAWAFTRIIIRGNTIIYAY